MPSPRTALLLVAIAAVRVAYSGFVCDVTQTYLGQSIEGHCDGSFEGAEFAPGNENSGGGAIALSGTLPTEFALLGATLQVVILSTNQISGTIPTEWGGLTLMTELVMSDTHISGTIPTELAQLSQLRNLQLWGSRLSGTVPPGLQGLDPALHPYWFSSPLNPPQLPSAPPSPPLATPPEPTAGLTTGTIIGISIGSVIGILVLAGALASTRRNKEGAAKSGSVEMDQATSKA